MKFFPLLLSVFGASSVLAPTVSFAADVAPPTEVRVETKEQHDARMGWWREAKYGLFIHWGLYAKLAGYWKGQPIGGYGEWIMNKEKIPLADYAAMASQFNPAQFDAESWVKLAKDAGMKYIVITAKHHEGFAMFHTKVDDYNIYDATAFKRDPIKELAEACRKHGLKFGLYYSQNLDWHHPGGGGAGWDPAHKGDNDRYVDGVVIPQVKEILSNYGEISVLWWDIPGGVINKERADRIYQTVTACSPGIIMNNRLGGGYRGDTETPEQHIPARGFPGRDWETCMTINNTWGFKKDDLNWKSTELLLRNLIDIASKGGNYLLNVGPDADGVIPATSVQRLEEVGAWLKTNGEAIYGTQAGPFARQPAWGRVTQKPGKLYLHVFAWPKDGSLLVPISNAGVSAHLLAQPAVKIAVQPSSDGVRITLPSDAPDPLATVIVLEFEGGPVVVDTIRPAANGSIQLTAADAELTGQLKLAGKEEENIGSWTRLSDSAKWSVELTKPGTFDVVVNYALNANSKGSRLVLSADGQKLDFGPQVTSEGWDEYRKVTVGRLTITKTGRQEFKLEVTEKPGVAALNLRSIRLLPVTL